MIQLPEWNSEFTSKSKRYTWMMSLYLVGRGIILMGVPWGLALAISEKLSLGQKPIIMIPLVFSFISILFIVEQGMWALKRRDKRRRTFLVTISKG